MPTRIEAVCDLLLAAAYADNHFDQRERDVITELLCGIQGTEKLEPALAARLSFRKPEDIDLVETVAVFENDSEDKRRLLMQLLAAVHDADGEYDVGEDELTIYVAGLLGFNTDEIREFSPTVEHGALGSALDELADAEPSD